MRRVYLFWFLVFSTHIWAQGVAVDAGWGTLRDINIEIKAGSPLDFSHLFPQQEGGVTARAALDSSGNFSIKGAPTRFLCAAMNMTPPYGGFPTHEESNRYALQLRRAGYNLVRIHHIDSTLMTGRNADFDYDPVQLDRFHFFLAAIKKQGIYWMLDAMSSENAAWGNVLPHRWVNRYDMKVRVHVDPIAQAHWKRLVETLYGRTNPYTGLSVLQDPALLGMSLVNEGGLQFITHLERRIPPLLSPTLRIWLRGRYTDQKLFEKTWGQPASNLYTGNLVLPPADERSPRMDDVLAFYEVLQAQTAKWMTEELASFGSQALTTAYNNMPTTHAMRTRKEFNWVDMHAYHDESLGFAPGAKIRNDSSFDKGLQYVLDLSTARLAGRAFTVSEYGQPFWNEWRRESALIVPAYAAFQNWGAICQHASTAVDLTYAQSKGWKQSILPYAVGQDPVGRVVETLAALMYRRGDVKTGAALVDIVLPGAEGEATSRYWGIPSAISRIALVARINARLAEEQSINKSPLASVVVAPDSQVNRKLAQWTAGMGINLSSGINGIDEIARMQKSDNKTAAAKGIYESGTGELLANFPARRFEVSTPLTRAIVFEKLTNAWSLGPLVLTTASYPGLVALSSLDNIPLTDSRKMLLIVASDALNTDMRFADVTRRELVATGRLPARVAPQIATFEFPADLSLKITALRANGERSETLPITRVGNNSLLRVDVANLQTGPSFYFEVERLAK